LQKRKRKYNYYVRVGLEIRREGEMMNRHLRSIFILLTLVLFTPLLSGCFGGAQATPDLTLTALFAPTQANPTFPPTWTPSGSQTATASTTPLTTATTNQTNTSTATATMTSTSAPLPYRYGPLAYAYYQSTSPTIDGNWGEWIDNTQAYPIQSLVYGASNWSGNADLDGSYILGWNYSYLFVGVKVHDDVYAQNASGMWIYLGDSIELLIDTGLYWDFYTSALNGDDIQLGISPGNPVGTNMEAFMWFPSQYAGGRSQVLMAGYMAEGIYRVEFRVPWSILGVDPYSGEALGFAISITDNDDPSSSVTQSMLSNDPYRHLTNPTTWGTLILR
jgi:hypothetical protein